MRSCRTSAVTRLRSRSRRERGPCPSRRYTRPCEIAATSDSRIPPPPPRQQEGGERGGESSRVSDVTGATARGSRPTRARCMPGGVVSGRGSARGGDALSMGGGGVSIPGRVWEARGCGAEGHSGRGGVDWVRSSERSERFYSCKLRVPTARVRPPSQRS